MPGYSVKVFATTQEQAFNNGHWFFGVEADTKEQAYEQVCERFQKLSGSQPVGGEAFEPADRGLNPSELWNT